MKITQLKPNHKDRRGLILDVIAGERVDAVTLITSKKGAVRGNHYHKKTVQYTYILAGRMRFLTRDKRGRLYKKDLGPGALVESPPGEIHTFKALTDCSFLSLSRGPRRGIDFEKDTYRLGPASLA